MKPRGKRYQASVPHGHRKTTTLVAALTTFGIAAPIIPDGAMDGDMLTAYVAHVLLKKLLPVDVVDMDNLPAHKVAGFRSSIESAGGKLEREGVFTDQGVPQKNSGADKAKTRCCHCSRNRCRVTQNAVNYFAAYGRENDTVRVENAPG